ncbi:hypothetical protein RRG08_037105 [Elysia crispata]|uniref:Uncharacterized protein n=1 Tax=Elysia crispata TaxID=231223 RepID=A0AAE0Y607_9GAST|nr:hypothetical protein RRG08_037105 [Elysia crispata]
MENRKGEGSESDSKPQPSGWSRIPIVRVIEPDETLTRDDLREPETKTLSKEVKVMTWQEESENHLGDSENYRNKNAMFLRVPLALKFGCHTCMQTMKQKYLRHFHRCKNRLAGGLPSLAVRNNSRVASSYHIFVVLLL